MNASSNTNQIVPPPTPTVPSPPKTMAASRTRMFSQPGFSTSSRHRQLVHSPQHIDDFGRRHSMNIHTRQDLRFDECTLQMMNDPNSVIYRRLSETLGQRKPTETRPTDNEEKLKLFEKYGPELLEFVKDKDGQLKSKFDKVFII